MTTNWKNLLDRWQTAGLLDAAAADRIRAYELERDAPQRWRWPVRLAVAFGGLMLAAGILLWVAAHWDDLSPAGRFSLVLLLVAVFHVAAAFLETRFSTLAITLRAVGTMALGAGIFLAGQIFNLEEHWPGGFMLWAAGAWLGWILFRDWAQAALCSVLTPIWLAGEWTEATKNYVNGERVVTHGVLLLAIAYFACTGKEKANPVQKALMWIGAIAVIPAAFAAAEDWIYYWWPNRPQVPSGLLALGWALAYGLPLALALLMRRRAAWMTALAAVWVIVLGSWGPENDPGATTAGFFWHHLGKYLWYLLGSVGMVAWGLYEERKERINLGIAGFAITVIAFYFASVMDKLGRANTLMGLGVLFLVGGWFLERTRRRLVARLDRSAV